MALQFTQFESDMVVDSAKRILEANEPKIVHVDYEKDESEQDDNENGDIF